MVRAEAADLFVGGEGDAKGGSNCGGWRVDRGGEKTGEKALNVAGSAAVDHGVVGERMERGGPIELGRNGVGVAEEGEVHGGIVGVLRGRSGDQVDLLDAGGVGVCEFGCAPADGVKNILCVRDDRAVGEERGGGDADEIEEEVFDSAHAGSWRAFLVQTRVWTSR